MKSLLSSLLLASTIATPCLAQSSPEITAATQPQQLSQAFQPVAQNNSSVSQPAVSLSNQTKGIYLTGAVGGNFPTNTTAVEINSTFGDYSFVDNHTGGFSAEVGVGYDFGSIRTEITYAYDGSTLANYSDQFGYYQYNGGSVSKNSVFASAYWDINLNSRLTPYIGGGLGYSNLIVGPSGDALSGAGAYAGYSAGAFAYQVKLGLSYLLSRRADAFVEGLYRGMSGYNTSDFGIQYSYNNYNSWGVQLGARVRF